MNFLTPTTKAEMYATLKEIFYYYRIRREGYNGATLKELELERLGYTPLTAEQITERARQELSSKHVKFKTEYVQNLNSKLELANLKLSALPQNVSERKNKISQDYTQSIYTVRVEAVKNGLNGSSIVIDKVAELENQKNQLLDQLELELDEKTAQLQAEIERITIELENAEQYCQDICDKEIIAKVSEISDEQAEIQREVFKYNNGLSEKEQRYSNSILQSNANLEMRFLEIRSGEYTKDELVEMGYYEDVINCVCAYYDRLDALTAAQEIMADTKILIYLDHYYESIVYLYQQRTLQ